MIFFFLPSLMVAVVIFFKSVFVVIVILTYFAVFVFYFVSYPSVAVFVLTRYLDSLTDVELSNASRNNVGAPFDAGTGMPYNHPWQVSSSIPLMAIKNQFRMSYISMKQQQIG